MPLHPSPPNDLPGLTEAWRHTVQAVIDLGHRCRGEDFGLDTACPGWTVQDQISHVTGTELWVATGEIPDVDLPHYPHIRHEFGAQLERAVEARRGRAGEAVVAELSAVLAMRQAQFEQPGLTLEAHLPGPMAELTVAEQLRLRIMDVWCHEQDIRQAMGRPGNLESPAAAVFLEGLFDRLPRLLGAEGVLEPGQSVVFHSTGPIEGRAGVRLELGEDGERIALPLFSGQGHHVEAAESITTIALTTEALTRRAAGRGSVDDVRATVTGDEALARRALDALPFVP